MEEGNILDLQERKDEDRRKIREEKARLARRAAIQVGTRRGRCGPCQTSLLASGVRERAALPRVPGALHGAGPEPALRMMECSPRRLSCHGALSRCAPAKPWQLVRSLQRQRWLPSSFWKKGETPLGQGECNCSSWVPWEGTLLGCREPLARHPVRAAGWGWSSWGRQGWHRPWGAACWLAA